jgi:hypothetical protein
MSLKTTHGLEDWQPHRLSRGGEGFVTGEGKTCFHEPFSHLDDGHLTPQLLVPRGREDVVQVLRGLVVAAQVRAGGGRHLLGQGADLALCG